MPAEEFVADPVDAAWLEELWVGIAAGDLARVAAAQAALRLPPGERPPLHPIPAPASTRGDDVPPAATQAAPPGRRLLGAYARRARGGSA